MARSQKFKLANYDGGFSSRPKRADSGTLEILHAGCTVHSTTAALLNGNTSTTTPTVKRHNQHKEPVRRTGSSPELLYGDQGLTPGADESERTWGCDDTFA